MGQRSGLATNRRRVELYLTWSLYAGLCIQPFWVLSAGPHGLALLLAAVLSLAHTAGAVWMARWSLRTMRRGGRFPRLPAAELRLMTGWLALSLLFAGLMIAFVTPVLGVAMIVWCGLSLTPVLSALAAFLVATGLGTLAGLGAGLFVGGPQGLAVGLVCLGLSYVLIGTYWLSALTLRVLWDLDAARGTASRLAVAEERLRFARDLHDVFGRTLSAVAVKSELGAELARRGQSEKAATQMTEVRQLAEDSGREVRDVVRGYRRADLAHEVIGARSVLQSAGVRTTIAGGGEGLPPDVSAALAWVTREAITNVLRHSDASQCTIAVDRTEAEATVVVGNDRPHPADPSRRGSGLTGLRERLAPFGGRVDVAHTDDSFTLTAAVPLEVQP
ncbi:MAG: sensor histidine kinase [Propionibacteriaceae bacterium]